MPRELAGTFEWPCVGEEGVGEGVGGGGGIRIMLSYICMLEQHRYRDETSAIIVDDSAN